jgi:sulfotransferase family protein
MDPVLIVGSPRSGTSALALGLSAAGISGYSEGHFLMLFARIEETIAKYYEVEAANNVPGALLHALAKDRVVEQYRQMARLMMDGVYDGKRWFDKTAHGGTIENLPFFKSIWPQAKIIFAKRRPIENLESRLRKFSHMSFAEHCKDLKYIFKTWAAIRDRLSGWVEIDQYDLLYNPAQATKTISGFLGFKENAAAAFRTTIENTYPERTSQSFKTKRFSELNWSQGDKELFVAELDDVMKLFNYGYDQYYVDRPSIAHARRTFSK